MEATSRPRGDKRAKILEAALELFAARGFYGTAVPEVARLAGVGAGTIYRYFESKEALVNVLLRHWRQALGAALLRGFPGGAPAREQFRAIWQRGVAFARRHPRAVHFLELHHHGPYEDAESRAVEEAMRQPIVQFVELSQGAGALKDVPAELLIHLVWGSFVGVVRGQDEGRLPATDALMAEAERCVWEAIRR